MIETDFPACFNIAGTDKGMKVQSLCPCHISSCMSEGDGVQ